MRENPEWPKVLQNDYGIRPAGNSNQCFYCPAKVGEPHGPECVMVEQRVEYLVHVGGQSWDDLSGEVVGKFTRADPWFWDEDFCEFHKNGSSWCAGNAVDAIEWLDTSKAKELKAAIEEQEEDSCPCHLLAFSFSRVIDPGPFRASDEE